MWQSLAKGCRGGARGFLPVEDHWLPGIQEAAGWSLVLGLVKLRQMGGLVSCREIG